MAENVQLVWLPRHVFFSVGGGCDVGLSSIVLHVPNLSTFGEGNEGQMVSFSFDMIATISFLANFKAWIWKSCGSGGKSLERFHVGGHFEVGEDFGRSEIIGLRKYIRWISGNLFSSDVQNVKMWLHKIRQRKWDLCLLWH